MINVTKTYLPPLQEYNNYLKQIWERGLVTNHGPLNFELEDKLKEYLGLKNLHYVSNGTIALQVAIKTLDLTGEIITTPFSYVATTTTILWENCNPVFVDIDDKTFCIDPYKIESKITKKTSAILATHVYGYPCNVERIDFIAKKYNLKVIYDGAHAFGVKYKGQSVLNYGDISTLSFHATKLFHTIEGGAIVTNDDGLSEKAFLYKSFGHRADEYYCMGINGKNSELHAAIGLCNLPIVPNIIRIRKKISETYKNDLANLPLSYPVCPVDVEYNYSYFPILFESESRMLLVKENLQKNNINTRRYFYPSLNKLPYVAEQSCPVSEDISKRILCLPLYHELADEDLLRIIRIIKESFNSSN